MINLSLRPHSVAQYAEILLPPSKSMEARALIIRALRGEMPPEPDPRDPIDICVLRNAIRNILSAGDLPTEVNVADSGTALRLLTAFIAASPRTHVRLTGSERLCQRTVAPLVDTLRELGADIEYAAKEGFAPLVIRGRRLEGGPCRLDASASSQPLSGLMLIAPYTRRGLRISVSRIVSDTYVRLTRIMMQRAGIESIVEKYPDGAADIRIPPGQYTCVPDVEADWSAASFIYEWVSLARRILNTDVKIRIPGLCHPSLSLQGDAAVASLYADVLTESDGSGITLSPSGIPYRFPAAYLFAHTPDLVPPVAVTAALHNVDFTFTDTSHLRIKESDRIASISANLASLGYPVEEQENDVWGWHGKKTSPEDPLVIDPFSDHRIAMAFAMAAMQFPGLTVADAGCVAKSFPAFWDILRTLGLSVQNIDLP